MQKWPSIMVLLLLLWFVVFFYFFLFCSVLLNLKGVMWYKFTKQTLDIDTAWHAVSVWPVYWARLSQSVSDRRRIMSISILIFFLLLLLFVASLNCRRHKRRRHGTHIQRTAFNAPIIKRVLNGPPTKWQILGQPNRTINMDNNNNNAATTSG